MRLKKPPRRSSFTGLTKLLTRFITFIWNSYCNWYVELIKPSLNDDDADAAAETRATASTILEGTLRLLHPFMPFLTEELNREIFASDDLLIAAQLARAGDGR